MNAIFYYFVALALVAWVVSFAMVPYLPLIGV